MRIAISVLIAAVVLTLPLSVVAAPSQQSTVDIKALALAKPDLQWRGFDIVPDRTVSEDRQDGVAVYDITFARERSAENLASGPFEVRSGVARTATVDDAVLQLESTKDAFIADGWAESAVPALGDQTIGLTQTTDADGGKIAHFSYLFRKGSYIIMIGVRGRPDTTKLSDAVGLAIVVSGRLDKALGSGTTTASSGAAPSTGTTSRQTTGEKVKVVNAGGGTVNMRAEPSTTAAVVSEVAEGTSLEIVGPNRDADGRTWRNVRSGDNQTGWIASTFLETTTPAPPPPAAAPAPPPPAPSPSPAPLSAPNSLPSSNSQSSTDGQPATDGAPAAATDGGTTAPTASTDPTPTPQAGSAGANTFKGSGNGIDVEASLLTTTLASGKQQVKVKVTRGGGPVADAFVDVTARLDARRFRSIKADNTSQDGYTEVEWDMQGPAGTYEVIVDVRTSVDGPATTAKSSFRWQ